MQIPISPQTRAALRVLVAKGLEQLITAGSAEPIRAARRRARRLEVTSPDGRLYSGVVVVHRNAVTTGFVVQDDSVEDAVALELPSSTAAVPDDLRAALAAARCP